METQKRLPNFDFEFPSEAHTGKRRQLARYESATGSIPRPVDGWINYVCKSIVFWLVLSLSANLLNLQMPTEYEFLVQNSGIRTQARGQL